MIQYSFDADLRSVLQRLAATRPSGTRSSPAPDATRSTAKLIRFHARREQPRLEIARVALRQRRYEGHGAMT
jgi:hypothetical protein